MNIDKLKSIYNLLKKKNIPGQKSSGVFLFVFLTWRLCIYFS